MKKRILIVLGILIAVGAIGTGVWYHFYGNGQSGNNDSIVYVSKVSVLTGVESAATNRFAGVVEPQETVSVKIESGRKVKEVQVKTGDEVKAGQLLFEYDLSSIQDDLQQAKLDLDRLKNEQVSLTEQIATLEAEKKKAKSEDQLSYTIEIETNKMNLKKNEYNQKSKTAEIEKLQNATGNTEVRSEIDGVIQKIDTSKMTSDDGDTVDDSDSSDVMSGGSSNSDSSAFITILSTGSYRVKGKVNEQNRDSVVPGEAVIIRSRVDSTKTWKGTMGSIDMNNGTSESNDDMNMMGILAVSGFFFIISAIFNPEMPSIIISSRIRSYPFTPLVNASSAEWTIRVSYPAFSRLKLRMLHISSSSSTMRILLRVSISLMCGFFGLYFFDDVLDSRQFFFDFPVNYQQLVAAAQFHASVRNDEFAVAPDDHHPRAFRQVDFFQCIAACQVIIRQCVVL